MAWSDRERLKQFATTYPWAVPTGLLNVLVIVPLVAFACNSESNAGNWVSALQAFIYLETFVAIVVYTVVTKRLHEKATEQAKISAKQSRLIRLTLQGQLYDSMRDATMRINLLFVDKPHLRPFFYCCDACTELKNTLPAVEEIVRSHTLPGPVNSAGEVASDSKITPEPITDLKHRLLATAECILDVFESVVRNLEQFPVRAGDYYDSWQNYIRSMFKSSPLLCIHLVNNHKWYVPRVLELAIEAVSCLEARIAEVQKLEEERRKQEEQKQTQDGASQ